MSPARSVAFQAAMPPCKGAFFPRQAANLRRAVAAFDSNHNGKLEPEELAALMQFLQGSVK